MKILITGASGYIGNKLAHALSGMGQQVHALVRSDSDKKWLQRPGITIFKGDILQKESLAAAMNGCQQVFHTAASVGVWKRDPSVFYEVNVEGTRNVLDAALQLGVDRTVCTSSCGVIGPTLSQPMAENDPRNTAFQIDYDLSKKKGEDLVLQYAKGGMNNVVVSPSKVYGPGNVSHSLTANAIINVFLKKRIAFIPSPGSYMVCFAFIDDIVNGHLLAMKKGTRGEKYILGGINISYYEFFNYIRALSACKAHIISLPKSVITGWARMQRMNHKLTGAPIRFTEKSVNHLFSNYTFSSEKATRELGYTITPLEQGLKKTIHFLKTVHE